MFSGIEGEKFIVRQTQGNHLLYTQAGVYTPEPCSHQLQGSGV